MKAKLSYAMVKVNHGWQSHSIDQVESLASQAGSPTSSTSTLHGRRRSSASPNTYASAAIRHRGSMSNGGSPLLPMNGTGYSGHWRGGSGPASPNGLSPFKGGAPALAPPVSIQPSRPASNARRNSNPRHAPAFLSRPHHASPHTPVQLYNNGSHLAHGTPNPRPLGTPGLDPILYAPQHQNVREQDAIESLLFMSSPGNSANLKHVFPSSQDAGSAASPRSALPTSHARRSLPSGRPTQQNSASQPLPKRVGFEKSPSLAASDMDLDDPARYGTPHMARTPRRPAAVSGHYHDCGGSSTPRLHVALSMPAALGLSTRPRRAIGEDDIDRMLDRVAAAHDDSSDSEDEIQIPLRRPHREGADVVGV